MVCRIVFCALVLLTVPGMGQEPAPQPALPADPAAVAFFEKEVRPVLIEHCQSCHGEKKQEAG
ncbi:MAG: hypothetical protein U0894_10070, partial [Pirellulales bacterium]